jgi:hypothetical protein
MSVNPNLAALMSVIEENQDKMTEGEYLKAMNALGALHREVPVPVPVPVPVEHPHASNRPLPFGNPPPSYAAASAAAGLFAPPVPAVMSGNVTEQRAWERVKNYHPDPIQKRISAEEWLAMSYESRFDGAFCQQKRVSTPHTRPKGLPLHHASRSRSLEYGR